MSSSPQAHAELHFTGSGVSSGVAIGTAARLSSHARQPLFINVLPHRVPIEIKRLHRALHSARHHLESVKVRLKNEAGTTPAYFLDPYILMLNDAYLTQTIEDNIRQHRVNAEWAVKLSLESMLAACDRIDDEYLRERSADIRDVAYRLISILSGQRSELPTFKSPAILFAEDILPTVLAEMNTANILAIATDVGGWATHTAIIARSLGIPAVFGLQDCASRVEAGMPCIVDGTNGLVILNPRKNTQTAYLGRQAAEQRSRRDGLRLAQLPALTLDNVTCRLSANIEIQSELPMIPRYGAESIGLFRSEFLLAGENNDFPDEDVQIEAYRNVLDAARGTSATIRVFDFNQDILICGERENPEANPALGLHGVRLWLKHEAIARTQLRAILRAGSEGDLRILLPRVTCVSEVTAARALLESVRAELRAEGLPHAQTTQLGVMIEIPSAVFVCEHLARAADFVSIGSNDLIQYLLAVDRTNEQVAHLYHPLHPAVLGSLRHIVEAAERTGKPVQMCGEMAANPLCAFALLGLGLRNFSLSPAALPQLKQLIRSVTIEAAQAFFHEAITLPTGAAIEEFARRTLGGDFLLGMSGNAFLKVVD
jgi:phosphoenolpyruvate-protein phosphotransferase (PTS system enzyme I)